MTAPPATPAPPERPEPVAVPFGLALRVWVRVALLSFGGPAGQIAVMHRILVEEKKWVGEHRFLHALNYCMVLPGPEAQQLATYTGWLLHGWRGGLTAGLLFVLPGFLSILVLSVLYAGFQGVTFVDALLFGLKPAVMAIVIQAVFRIGRRALNNAAMVLLAGVSFVSIFFLEVPFPVIVLTAAGVGLVGGRLWPQRFGGRPPEEDAGATQAVGAQPPAVRPTLGRAARVGALWLGIWLLPLLGLSLLVGTDHVFVQEGVFFSKAAVLTFGGAYAVLAYIAQRAVEDFAWLQPGEMLDGLGMAETTPGPLIQVVQFVGFMAAYRNPGELDPMLAGVLGSLIVTWVTFAPCFLWIFLGAPYIEALRGNRALASALSAITATVVGVILNLALWFSLHVLFAEVHEQHRLGLRLLVPDLGTIDPGAALIALGSFVAMFRFRVGMLPTLAGGVLLGAAWYALVH